jgi:3-phosphoshikimate 1-carboxyvinyltransferase
VIIHQGKAVRGRLKLPGDKSISHRAAMMAALAHGRSSIQNFASSADCSATLSCLEALGVSIERTSGDLVITGVGLDGFRQSQSPLDCGNSGTTMRLMAGILAKQSFASTLIGDESLHSRPMQRIIEPLQMMGADISSNGGRAPLVIQGGGELKPLSYELLVASAQVKSCILFAGLNANGRTEVIENQITRDHTERMLSGFGVPVETGKAERKGENARFIAINGPAKLTACDLRVPGDVSSAAYFLAAAALLPNSSLEINDVGLNPTRTLFIDQLRGMGFGFETFGVREVANEPAGSIRVTGVQRSHSTREPFTVEGLAVPQLIDELPLLAVVGSQIEGGIEVRDAAELRVKESDRIALTVQNLRAMGGAIDEFDDGFRVHGPVRLRGARVNPYGDHRIAMTFSVAALLADGQTTIADPECVAVSFPDFFRLLDSVVVR